MMKILKILFCKKAIWCVVMLFVLSGIVLGFSFELVIQEPDSQNLYTFGQLYPLIAKCISATLKVLGSLAVFSVFYMQFFAVFKLHALFFNKKNAYFERIKLLLFFQSIMMVTLALALAQYRLFLTVQDELGGVWFAYLSITSPLIGIVASSLQIVTCVGSFFCVFELRKYWKEIKSFYFIPCLYPLALIICYGFWYGGFFRGGKSLLSGSLSLLVFVMIIGTLWLDYKRSITAPPKASQLLDETPIK